MNALAATGEGAGDARPRCRAERRGKDTLIAWCKTHFAGDPSVIFPRRAITRQHDESEDHDPISEAAFDDAVAAGAFALQRRVHGLGYGIQASIVTDLAAGRSVEVNVSRTVIDEARRRFAPVIVVSVTVPPAIIAARLHRRNREAAFTGRLLRAGAHAVTGQDVVVLDNSGTIPAAGARFAAIIAGKTR